MLGRLSVMRITRTVAEQRDVAFLPKPNVISVVLSDDLPPMHLVTSSFGLVFSDAVAIHDALARLKLDNLDTGILGEEFPQHEVTVVPNTGHFDLMVGDRLLPQVDEIVAAAHGERKARKG